MTRTIITATPPTPNGDLHVGHLSGPYLGGDVCARYRRMLGEDVAFITGTDANQTYVLSSAERKGMDPQEMADHYAAEISRTLQAAAISVDAFVVPDARHSAVVQAFYMALHDKGLFVTKKKKVLWSESGRRFADFAFVSGFCPNCFSETAESVCEACAHPVGPENIIDPRSAANPDEKLTLREVDVLVLELERHRRLLEVFYGDKWGRWRPHILELVEQVMAKPLPDFALTCVSSWGVPAPFPGFEGQVMTGWAELLPGFMRAVEGVPGVAPGDGGKIWQAPSQARLIQFLGFDNVYFFAVPHVVLSLLSSPRCITADPIITNEFYQLNNFKFSTSKNNVVLGRDAIAKRSVDQLRLYLCLNNPELQKANFSFDSMDAVIGPKFIEPWARITPALNALHLRHGLGRESGRSMTAEHAARTTHLYETLDMYYGTARFSLQRAAEMLTQFWGWFEHEIEEAGRSGDRALMTSLWGLLEAQSTAMFPILPDFSQALLAARPATPRSAWREIPSNLCPFLLQEEGALRRAAI